MTEKDYCLLNVEKNEQMGSKEKSKFDYSR